MSSINYCENKDNQLHDLALASKGSALAEKTPEPSALTDLQTRYFSSKEKCQTLLQGLFSSMKKQNPITVMAKSNVGATGFTFLCTTPTTHIKGEKEVDEVSIVLKWQKETQCKIEEYGARVFQHLGFNPPSTFIFDNKLSENLMELGAKEAPAMGSLIGQYPCLVMPRLYCNNLFDLAKRKDLLSLKEPQLTKLVNTFGKVTAVDLLIGNNDRFIAFPQKHETDTLPKGHINGGNILVHLNEGQVEGVYPIDNCPSPSLIKREKTTFESLGMDTMFDDVSSSDSTSQSESIEEWDSTVEVNHLKGIFKRFTHNPEVFSAQFTDAFIRELHGPSDHVEQLRPLVQKAFLKGIQEQLLLIKTRADAIKEEINTWDTSDESVSLAKKLTFKNLKHLKG